ncbi:hypothetical protein C900_03086 [Fulvivirga imtechensis AK7]|uniref:Uncharacterized protein n=1 Tax=Fulvivirga imtechensis AK7 TaxID=1237149 RepID=L8JV31_9BACT|nr:hypothetical protein C900_03086 [Fulvivirga imtechensis AK7]
MLCYEGITDEPQEGDRQRSNVSEQTELPVATAIKGVTD